MSAPTHLSRRITLLQATAINMIDMAGIGPFVVLYLVIRQMGGPYFLYAWFAGAALALIDSMIWSELGAAWPRAGGSYNFLKVAYGEEKWGRLLSFLYVWQTLIQAPLVMASAAIGFAAYLNFFLPLTPVESKLIAVGVVLAVLFALCRRIEAVGRISLVLWVCLIGMFLWIIAAGVSRGHFFAPLGHINDGLAVNKAFFFALGAASVNTIYCYLGYYNVCQLGGEIVNPGKNIPRSMFLSVVGIAILYLAMNLAVTSVIPWAEARDRKYVVSDFFHLVGGSLAANIATIAILIIAFASLFSTTLGYSRVPYAAARDGAFFRIFARLHPTKGFPYVSLLFLGAVALVFTIFLDLDSVIKAIPAVRILVQFIGQAIGVVLLRKKYGTKDLPFKMWLYPLPVIVSIAVWLALFFFTGKAAIAGLVFIAIGIVAYAAGRKRWARSAETTA